MSLRSPRRFFWIVLGLTMVAFVVAAPNKPVRPGKNKDPQNFQRTKARIEALLGPRLKPEPPPDSFPNPFQLAETPAVVTPDKDPKPIEKLPVSSDEEMLLYYGTSLRITGVVRINDQTHLVINQTPYKEGDTLNLKTKDGTVKLRVVAIAPGELTLGLNGATQVIKFKK